MVIRGRLGEPCVEAVPSSLATWQGLEHPPVGRVVCLMNMFLSVIHLSKLQAIKNFLLSCQIPIAVFGYMTVLLHRRNRVQLTGNLA